MKTLWTSVMMHYARQWRDSIIITVLINTATQIDRQIAFSITQSMKTLQLVVGNSVANPFRYTFAKNCHNRTWLHKVGE